MDNLRSASLPLIPVGDCHRRDQTARPQRPFGGFTEGFNTLDQKEATALLEELAS
jgi:hypothetical protein